VYADLYESGKRLYCFSSGCTFFKGSKAICRTSGPEIIKIIKTLGKAKIFLDLKLHDIPETVSRAMASIADLGVDFATVHCGENKGMLEAAVAGSGGRVGVLGVTVLTSVLDKDLLAAGFRSEFASDLSNLVIKRASIAKKAGCAGVVCSGLEVAMIKKNFGKGFMAITPGIRPDWDVLIKDDQQRITTPAVAIKNGADYLVIGRPIRDANDPKEAAIRITKEIEAALQ
jgi:orotidine-5'-phosphate decarboxylase